MSANTTQSQPHGKYDRLIAAAKAVPPVPTIVVHPCDRDSLRGVVGSAEAGIIRPVLVGPETKIRIRPPGPISTSPHSKSSTLRTAKKRPPKASS